MTLREACQIEAVGRLMSTDIMHGYADPEKMLTLVMSIYTEYEADKSLYELMKNNSTVQMMARIKARLEE